MKRDLNEHEGEDVPAHGLEEKKPCFPKGVAHLKPEYIVNTTDSSSLQPQENNDYDDEENGTMDRLDNNTSLSAASNRSKKNKQKRKRGQNKNRDNRQSKEDKKYLLCPKLIRGQPLDNCPWGESCRFNHDVDLYLKHKLPEIDCNHIYNKVFLTYDHSDGNANPVIKLGCPIYNSLGYCPMGFKCRFLSHHGDEKKNQEIESVSSIIPIYEVNKEINHISYENKNDLIKRNFNFPKSEYILEIIDAMQQENRDNMMGPQQENTTACSPSTTTVATPQIEQNQLELQEIRNKQKEIYLKFKDTRYFASEKRKLDYKGKKILSPLTTVGNLPFRRLMKKYGCDITYSEMALAVPLIQGTNSEWALPKAHISERGGFGVQIACSKVWQASKAAEALAKYCEPNGINEINLNSGCPIDLLYRQGSGSALLDNPARLIRCLNGMNYVSNDIPITVKIRTGTKDGHPMANLLVKRLVQETDVAAITLHGRTRQQRYTKLADWEYIGEVARTLRASEIEYNESVTTTHDNINSRPDDRRIQFIGNGDINNWEDWYHYRDTVPEMDSIMIARGALIKPWIWEEIDSQQYIDKSSSERMDMLSDFVRYAMEHWGTDEYGIAQCRRYFCEFMSFFHRYVPMGICARYPVKLNERPPYWHGRDELETKMGSLDVQDWIQLSEQFLGPVEANFQFTPKHKSNSYK